MQSNDGRRQQILDLVAGSGYGSVQALSQRLQVSEMTIRRDLDELEQRGLIRRIHGGAMVDPAAEGQPIDFKVRRGQRAEAKARIARAAAERIQDNQVVYLDAGTTVLAITDALAPRQQLRVITPSLPLATALTAHPHITTILLGGTVRPELLSVAGTIAEQNLATFHLDLAILGTSAFDLERGLSQSTLEEIPLKRLAAQLATRVVVAATREKHGRSGLMYFLGPDEIDEIITDAADGQGVEVLLPMAGAARARAGTPADRQAP